MNYEQKYKEALERARKLATDLPNGRNDRLYHVWDLENIFPELKESEDERIKNEIIDYIILYQDSLTTEEYNSWISWLENPNRKVVTRRGNPVRILCTDCGVMMSHPILTEICSGKAKVLEYHYIDRTTQNKNNDLFFADEEKLNSIIDELKSYIEKTPKEQVEKDWKEIQDWYTQHFTNEKHNEEEELTEFELRLLSSLDYTRIYRQDYSEEDMLKIIKDIAQELLDLARKEIRKEQQEKLGTLEMPIDVTEPYYIQGKQDALKGLPKWKKATEHKEFEVHVCVMDEDMFPYLDTEVNEGEYYIELSDLKTLPKEE